MLMLFLYTPGAMDEVNEPIIGRTRLMKMSFLFEKELKNSFFRNEDGCIFEFVAYLFGPYSSEEMRDLTFLMDANFVLEEDTAIPISSAEDIEGDKFRNDESLGELWDEMEAEPVEKELYEKKYLLSEKGIRYIEERVWGRLEPYQESLMRKFKTQITKIPLDELLRYVYQKYPEYTENSTIKEKYL